MKEILKRKELNDLSKETKIDLYYILLQIEDELNYKNKKICNTINYLQTMN